MREMPTKPRRRGANHDALMVSAPRFAKDIEMQTRFAVMHKATGQLFAGFDSDNQPTWTNDERKARAYGDKSEARGQALLFVRFGVAAQQKPVTL